MTKVRQQEGKGASVECCLGAKVQCYVTDVNTLTWLIVLLQLVNNTMAYSCSLQVCRYKGTLN